jgi:hypothetical protein
MRRHITELAPCLLGALLVSCGAPGVPIPPELELPKPVTDLRAVRKGEKVTLVWSVPAKTTEGQALRHMGVTRICRSLEVAITDCKSPVTEVPANQVAAPAATAAKPGSAAARPQASYTDTLPKALQVKNPAVGVIYAVDVRNDRGRSAGLSNQAKVPAVPTLPAPENFRAEVTGPGVLLSWACASAAATSSAPVSYRIRVYRRSDNGKTDSRVGEADARDCSRPGWLDQTFEWEKTYWYRATTVTVVAATDSAETEVEGDDTPEVKVFAHDIFPPAVPTDLQAVFSGVGQTPFIDLVWAPDTDADLAGYIVFRHEEGGPPVKINAEIVKTPAYRDTNVVSGMKYFYSVSAVDVRGNESARSEEANETVP